MAYTQYKIQRIYILFCEMWASKWIIRQIDTEIKQIWQMTAVVESKWRVGGNSLHYSSNFSVCVKVFRNKFGGKEVSLFPHSFMTFPSQKASTITSFLLLLPRYSDFIGVYVCTHLHVLTSAHWVISGTALIEFSF